MLRQVLKRIILLTVIALPCVGCDQVTKQLAQDHLAMAAPRILARGTLRLQYAENHGAFLSVGQGMSAEMRRLILIGGSAALIAATLIVLLFVRGITTYLALALSLMVAGGLGNLCDRLLHDGAVIDFINVGIGGLRTGIFNLADVYLSIGVLMCLVAGRITSPRWSSVLR